MDPPVLFVFIDRFSIYLGRQRGCPEAREGAQVMERWWENPGSPVPPTFQLTIHLLMHLTVGFFFSLLLPTQPSVEGPGAPELLVKPEK